MKRKLLIGFAFLLSVLIVFTGCSAASRMSTDESSMYDYDSSAGTAPQAQTDDAKMESLQYAAGGMTQEQINNVALTSPTTGSMQEKMIYTASMTLECDDPKDAVQKLEAKAEELGGYVESSKVDGDTPDVRGDAQIVLKLPGDTMEDARKSAEELGSVKDFMKNSENVSQQYYDIQTRLASAQAKKQRTLEILDKATTVEDIMSVQTYLDNIIAEIESYEGQLNYLDASINYSTLTINIQATEQAVSEKPEWVEMLSLGDTMEMMRRGVINTGRALVKALSYLLIALSYLIIPLMIVAIIIGLVVLIVKANARKRQKRSAETK